jgi:hypothetical protein
VVCADELCDSSLSIHCFGLKNYRINPLAVWAPDVMRVSCNTRTRLGLTFSELVRSFVGLRIALFLLVIQIRKAVYVNLDKLGEETGNVSNKRVFAIKQTTTSDYQSLEVIICQRDL